MIKICRIVFAFLFVITISFPLFAQRTFFTEANENSISIAGAKRVIIPQKYKTLSLDRPGIESFLRALPFEKNLTNKKLAPVIELPMPDGKIAEFRVWESLIMEPALAGKYPGIKTYAGQGIDDPSATVRMDYNPYFGFSAQILSVNGNIYIDPYAKGNTNYYISYYTKDYRKDVSFVCSALADIMNEALREQAGACRGTQLAIYRLALACTGEYAAAVCSPAAPTTPATLAAMTTSVNRVDGVYESELAIRLVLVANNDLLVYLDGTSDPYTNGNGSTMLGENQTNIDNVIFPANYDIGHVFSTGGGGVASVGVVCGASKARGVTGSSSPTGDAYDIDYVAHEMGHQFGARHTFNSTTSQCGSNNRNGSTAYEVGSATTIMGYAGICGTDNIQANSDPFFHSVSFDEISTYVQGNGSICPVLTNTGNTLPQITAMNNNGANIPLSTPFTLTATATDADGDALTYDWEEWDLGPSGAWNSGANSTTAPLFKSRVPKTTGSRTFPDIAVILAGYPSNPTATMGGLKGETLPGIARAMKFRLTVRDNRANGGGVVTGGEGCQTGFTGTFQINTIDGTGPFIVTFPSATGISLAGGGSQTITWNVAGTDGNGINCANVKITLSTDGGLTYPTVLTASTPNDGSESLVLPNISVAAARIKIEAIGNIFFDISDNNFSIAASSVGFDFNTPAPVTAACPVGSMDITLGTISFLGFSNPITLSASGAPAGTNVTFIPGNSVTPGNNVTVRLNNTNSLPAGSYTITITGTATGASTRTRDLIYTIQAGSAPSITVQPQSQQACAGTNATFSVTSPAGLSYQWQISTNGGGSFSAINGAVAASYTVTSVTTDLNNNQYRVIVTGQCNSVTSAAATLTILTAPAITAQPQSITLCTGSNNTFSVAATGSNLTYQWQLSTDGGTVYNPAPGANTSFYTVSGITAVMNNYRYRAVISGICSPAATSAVAVLTVISPVTITTQPNNASACATIGSASFTVAGSGAGVLYQWEVSTNGGTSYTDVTGATSATLTLNNLTDAMNSNLYRAKLYNATCTIPAVSNSATLTVLQRSAITLTASSVSILPGEISTLTATATPAAGVTYSWFKDGVLLNGITGTAYSVSVTGLGNYQVKIVNASGCTNESGIVTIGATASNRLFIYPSPNDGQFTVSYYNSGGVTTQQTIAIYDSKGAMVYSNKLAVTGPYQLHPINLKGSGRGIYYVVIGDASGKKLAKGKVVIH